jgi:hypothetical protein
VRQKRERLPTRDERVESSWYSPKKMRPPTTDVCGPRCQTARVGTGATHQDPEGLEHGHHIECLEARQSVVHPLDLQEDGARATATARARGEVRLTPAGARAPT